ncbi:beta-ketoacyl synthase N-terminal-like domain-containing protein [Actinoplanes sp. NPDC051861]|uniref:beta-ketoacyl synthase N-terminal-like domain-containing protein n=1 Tax=Actinoplanes sp. NPDC051861 TaxID=3155170 RepID=UPI00341A8906
MSGVAITGWSAITSAGVGAEPLAVGVPVPQDVRAMFDDPLPVPSARALPGFDVRTLLGRKGTSSFDRATALAVVCCREALRSSPVDLDAGPHARTGVVLGTSLGSFKSTSDYSRETLVQERPYLVNPVLFPNTVMNGAAGQVAIRFGLRGVNATIAGGPLAFLNAVRYARNVLDRGYADTMVAGAVEEFTPHRAWAVQLAGEPDTAPAGEAAAFFVLSRTADGGSGARILSVATGYGPGGTMPAGTALTSCVGRALRQAGADSSAVGAVVTGSAHPDDDREYGPAVRALGHHPEHVPARRLLGDCGAATGAAALAVVLAGPALPAARPLVLLTGRGADGAVGAAIVEGSGDERPDRG